MTNDQTNALFEAARLVRLAINARETVARNREYQQLLQRFHTDPEFRDLARTVARGLDLQIFELARDIGLAVVNVANGPYAPTLDDFRGGMRARERIVYGLLLAMLAAYVYPTRRAIGELDDSSVVSIELRSLVEWASTATREMRQSASATDVASPELRSGFEAIAMLEPFGDGHATLHYRFRYILEWLVKNGLFACREEGGRELWIARPHYRIQARHLMLGTHAALLEWLGQLAARTEGS